MPAFSLVLFAVLAILAVGAFVERHRGHRYTAPEQPYDSARVEVETHMRSRNAWGSA